MRRRDFLRAGALAGAAAAAPSTLAAAEADTGLASLAGRWFSPVRGAGTVQDPLRLNANENPLGISPSARQAAIDAFAVANRYTDNQAAVFRSKLAPMLGVRDEEVFLGNGSTEVLQMAVQAYGGEGARIVTADPTFEDVAGYRLPLDTELVKVPLDVNHAHDLGRMREAAAGASGRAVIYLCNPNNPTGTLTPTGDVAEWIDEVAADDSDRTVFLIDEAYFELVEDPSYDSLIPRARTLNDVLVVRTFSKIYGMAGMRLGYGVGNGRTVQQVTEWIANNNTNQLAMAAASASLDDDAFRARSLELNRASRQLVMDTLDELGLEYLPSNTNFIMHRIQGDVREYIGRFRERGIAVGRPFPPMLDYNRLSLGSVEEMGRWAGTIRDFRARGWV
ncbi:MAG: aminotransferase class I/II-fold pyridoxal phosphate-dependent enzyme [Gemmatimonadetes bacterium]|nr:aminotransferase class I/II-fold pyridoxal phosphate-dependent enzyme [Gemmatimonadota bacterium]